MHRPWGDVYIIFSTTPESVSLRYGDTGSPLLIALHETLIEFGCSNQIGFLEWVNKLGIKMQDDYNILIETRDLLDKVKQKTFFLSTKEIEPSTYIN